MKLAPTPLGRLRTLATLALTILLSMALLPSLRVTRAAGDPQLANDRVAGAFRLPVPDNYHARLDPAVADQASKTGSPIRRATITPAEQVAVDALATTVPALHVERDEVSQLPIMVMSYQYGTVLEAPSRKAAASPEASAREFLRSHKALYGASDNDLASLKTRYVTRPEGGATIVKMNQYAGGIEVFDAEMAVVMTKQNEVVATSGRFYPEVSKAPGTSSFVLSAADAISRGINDLTSRNIVAGDLELVRGEDAAHYSLYAYSADMRPGATRFLSEDVRVKKVLFPLAAGRFVPSYYLELWVTGEPAGSGPVFSYVVNAEDGTVLFRNNLTSYDTYNYRVYADGTGDKRPWDGPTGTIGTPHPTGTPNGYQAPFIAAPVVSVESLLGATDPWLPAAATATTGNNTDAYLDIGGADGFNTGDIRGATTSANTFDYQYNSANPASDATNRQAAVVGMFYQVNWLHDVWYQHGFTEAAGNAQTDNYGRGGVGGDSLKAEGQDQSGTDNANMSTPADGGRPRMQMYTFNAGGRLSPTRDGTFDMLIVGHEMGHYISNRLIGNGSGLGNRQGGAMGEGWGDFNCILTTAQPTDDTQATYAIGGQTDIYFCNINFVDNYYYSIRRYPYSAQKIKNPLTFKDIGSGITTYPGVSGNPCLNLTSSPNEVHNAGEIWCEMLWQCYADLAGAYGASTARDKMLQYYIDGMKATPSSPTYTQARDGVIAAAAAANGYANPKDSQILWKAFSKRGIGSTAVSPASSSNTLAGVVEGFTAAPGLPDDTFGVYSAGNYFERDVLFGGSADTIVNFGLNGTPFVGNWDGGATVGAVAADNPGFYDPSNGFFFLKNSQTPGPADLTFSYGPPGITAITGDWDGL